MERDINRNLYFSVGTGTLYGTKVRAYESVCRGSIADRHLR